MEILYSRANLLRKPRFRIGTTILKNNGVYYVNKYSLTKDSEKHIIALVNNEVLIKKNFPGVRLPKIIKQDRGSLLYEYLPHDTLEQQIENHLFNHRFDQTYNVIQKFKKFIKSLPNKQVNIYSNLDFVNFFDPKKEYLSTEKITCLPIALLDLNFDNLLDYGKSIYLIDYEWLFNFPLPTDYLFFRSILFLSQKLQLLLRTLASQNFPLYEVLPDFYIPTYWFNGLDLPKKNISQFLHYENAFQNMVISVRSNIDLRQINKGMDHKFPRTEVEIYKVNDYNISNHQDLNRKIITLEQKILELSNINNDALSNITKIKSSKFYRLWQTYNSFIKKIKLKSR